MNKFSKELQEGLVFFTSSLDLMPVLEEIPIDELRNTDIFVLQRLSKAAGFDGVCILLGVDFQDKNLVAMNFSPNVKSKPRKPFVVSPESAVYIGNDVSPDVVTTVLRDMARRYTSLNPPPLQAYEDGDSTVLHDEWLNANAKSKSEHDLFMRENGMDHTSIPPEYK